MPAAHRIVLYIKQCCDPSFNSICPSVCSVKKGHHFSAMGICILTRRSVIPETASCIRSRTQFRIRVRVRLSESVGLLESAGSGSRSRSGSESGLDPDARTQIMSRIQTSTRLHGAFSAIAEPLVIPRTVPLLEGAKYLGGTE